MPSLPLRQGYVYGQQYPFGQPVQPAFGGYGGALPPPPPPAEPVLAPEDFLSSEPQAELEPQAALAEEEQPQEGQPAQEPAGAFPQPPLTPDGVRCKTMAGLLLRAAAACFDAPSHPSISCHAAGAEEVPAEQEPPAPPAEELTAEAAPAEEPPAPPAPEPELESAPPTQEEPQAMPPTQEEPGALHREGGDGWLGWALKAGCVGCCSCKAAGWGLFSFISTFHIGPGTAGCTAATANFPKLKKVLQPPKLLAVFGAGCRRRGYVPACCGRKLCVLWLQLTPSTPSAAPALQWQPRSRCWRLSPRWRLRPWRRRRPQRSPRSGWRRPGGVSELPHAGPAPNPLATVAATTTTLSAGGGAGRDAGGGAAQRGGPCRGGGGAGGGRGGGAGGGGGGAAAAPRNGGHPG